MQIIGLCRFSYPAVGGFQVEHDDLSTRQAYLWEDSRLEARFRHFETLCLPSLRGQSDPDFTLLILIGEAMPDRWRARLENLVADMPQVAILARAPGPHRKVCREAINAARDMSQPCVQFRHDDDDAVHLGFVAALRAVAADCSGLLEKHRLVGFDWQRGYTVEAGPRGLSAEAIHTPYLGLAQAVAVRAGTRATIMNFGHSKLAAHMPTVTFSDKPFFLRGLNGFNDSRSGQRGDQPGIALLDAAGEATIRENFGVCGDHIRAVFGGTDSDVRLSRVSRHSV